MDLKTYLSTGETSQADLARSLGVTAGLVWQWIHGHRSIAAERVLAIEKATGGKVSRHELRPDIYPCEFGHSTGSRKDAIRGEA